MNKGTILPQFDEQKAKSCRHNWLHICDCPWGCSECGMHFETWAYSTIAELKRKLERIDQENGSEWV